jgi:hypothetical protein
MSAASRVASWALLTAALLTPFAVSLAEPAAEQPASQATSRAFAAAQSSTYGRYVCVGDVLGLVRDCALAKCRAGAGRDCRVVAACDRAQWSGSLAVALQGGRFSVTICGVPSRPGLIIRMKDLCRSYRARGLEACTLDSVWTPAGEEELAGLRWNRQTLGRGRFIAR